MKSIANQYRDLQEGKMSQANFMRNLRMSMPQVTNTTSFGDAVKILKNKGIITESFDITEKENDEYPTPPVASEEPNEDAEFDAMLKQLEDEMGGDEAVKGQYDINESNVTKKQVLDTLERLFNENENRADIMGDVAKELNITKQELAKIIGISDLYSAKPSMNEAKETTNPNSIHPQEYTMGIRYELKVTKGDVVKAERAVLKNLAKEPFYYTALKLAGKDIYKEKAAKPEVTANKQKAAKPELVDKANGMVKVKMPKTVKEAMMNEDLEDIDRAFDKSDININTNDEKRVQSAVDSYSRLISALKAINSINETDGLFKIFLEHTLLVNVSKEQLIAQLRKALTTYPGSTFTSPLVSSTTAPAAAISPKKGFPGFGKGADLEEKLTSMVREMLAEETPSKKTASSEITAKAVEYIDDYNEGEKTYKKSQLENVFDSYEDKVGRRFDDSVFEDVIDMLKAKGYTMDMKETFDGRDNLDAENEVN